MEDNKNLINDDGEISFIDISAVLFRYKWMILGITCFVAVIMVAFTMICIKLPPEKSPKPPVFESQIQLIINENASSNAKKYNILAGKMLKSSKMASTLDSELTEKGVKNAEEKLKNNISYSWDNGSGTFTISFKDNYPESPKIVLDAIAAYLKEYLESVMDEARSKELEKFETQLKDAESLLNKYQKTFEAKIASKGDVRIEQQNYNTQLTKYNTAKTEYEKKVQEWKTYKKPLEIFEEPNVKAKKVAPDRKKPVIISVVTAFILSVVLAFLLDFIDHIKADKEIQAKFHEPTIFSKKYK